MKLGRYHACDGCGLTWHGEAWPTACPGCKRAPHWIASFHFPEHAQAHQPLGATAAHTSTTSPRRLEAMRP